MAGGTAAIWRPRGQMLRLAKGGSCKETELLITSLDCVPPPLLHSLREKNELLHGVQPRKCQVSSVLFGQVQSLADTA